MDVVLKINLQFVFRFVLVFLAYQVILDSKCFMKVKIFLK